MSSKLPTVSHTLNMGRSEREYLGHSYFFLTIVATLVLHLIALYAWHLAPQNSVEDIPVHVLNIKLGDDTSPLPQASAGNKGSVESAISKLIQQQDVVSTAPADTSKNIGKVPDTAIVPAPHHIVIPPDNAGAKQLVRKNAVQANTSKVGNSTATEAELMSRYEQLISLWIEKFKLYPDAARAHNMQGDTIIRIRIDRQGNILYYILEHSTGYPLLDHAVIDMIKRANPVPAVPTDYPKADLIEFLIPVNFHLQ